MSTSDIDALYRELGGPLYGSPPVVHAELPASHPAADARGSGGRHGILSNPYWQADMAQVGAESSAALAPGSGPSGYKWETQNWNQPYANAANGSAQQTANTQYALQMMEQGNKIDSAIASTPSGWEKLGMMIGMAPVAAVGGGVLAPAIAGAVGGGVAGAVAGGVGAGAFTGAGDAALTGGNVGRGALVGGALGGLGGGLNSGLAGDGLTNTENSIISKAGMGAASGALSGHGALSGAEGGALSGAVSSAFSSGANPSQTDNGGIPASQSPGTNPMSADPYDFMSSGANDTLDPLSLGNVIGDSGSPYAPDPLTPYQATIGGYGGQINTDSLQGAIAGNGYGSGDASGSFGGSAGGSLLGSLARLLTGGGGGGGGSSAGLLAQLLGLGATGAGNALNSSAARGAADRFAGQTAFNPYSVSTNGGTTNFDGTHVTSTLSPQEQALSKSLGGLSSSAAGQLAQGTQGTQQQIYNQLQASQAGANNKFYQNNLDNQFANGVLSSTAGQYQSQAALGAIGQQQTQDHITAQNMASTQQQNQLNQLTQGLNGMNSMNASQLAQIQAGGNLGAQASNANDTAYQPRLAANSGSVVGNLLSGLGNSATTNAGSANDSLLARYLAGQG